MKITCLLIALLSGALVASAEDRWELLTTFRNVQDLVYSNGSLWCATTGGLAEFDTETRSFSSYTTADGMAGVGMTAVEVARDGSVWLAFENLMFQRFVPGRGITHTISAIAGDGGIGSIRRILSTVHGVYLATNRGIARITYVEQFDRWVWFEEFSYLGELPPETGVVSLQATANGIWAATPNGLVMGENLEDSQPQWQTHTSADGLPSDNVRDVAAFQEDIYAATDQGVARWDGSAWTLVDPAADIGRLMATDDSLFAVRSSGLFVLANDGLIRYGDPRQWTTSAARDGSGRIWLGVQVVGSMPGGVATLEAGEWVDYYTPGPALNLMRDIAFGESGDVYIVGGRLAGAYGLNHWDGVSWNTWVSPHSLGRLFNYSTRGVTVDTQGNVWVGSSGGGLGIFRPDSTFQLFDYSEETGQRLVGYGYDPPELKRAKYVLAPALEADRNGNVWVVNRTAYTGEVLICIPRDYIVEPDSSKEWIYFHRSLFRNYPHFELITIDGHNRKWIASVSPEVVDGQGVYVFDDNGTLNDRSDDRVWGPMEGLSSGRVYDLEWDPAGYIWAGAGDGAYYIDAASSDLSQKRFTQIYQLRDVQVEAIEVDPAGNKWFGTDFGVTIMAPDLFTIVRQITDEPPDMLPSPRVTAIGVNPHNGWAYIGTEDGIVALRTPYVDYSETIQSLSFEPNPFNPNEGKLYLTGTSLGANASARIFTPDGRIVRKLGHNEAALGWDGRNDTGQKVADGVYLILTHGEDGSSSKGKVAVIWR